MTDTPPRKPRPPKPAAKADPAKPTPEGERIAKVLSRAGVSSRREAERLIQMGEVTVNGQVIDSPALNVTPKDKITVSGQPLKEPEPARLWLYYKPEGLVTSAADEKGRETVFDNLPEDMPRVMSVGRLDLNSEGLLLLTNDGELKRRLELPSTGWLRKYRVRVNGNPVDPDLDPLRKGITVDGKKFQPMEVSLDRVQGANAWLTIGLREGKNREIRRAMSAIGLYVNRLIRVSYGPFRLNELQPGEVEEVRPKVLRDQLGLDAPQGSGRAVAKPARLGGAKAKPPRSAEGRPARTTEAKPPRTSAAKPSRTFEVKPLRSPYAAKSTAPEAHNADGKPARSRTFATKTAGEDAKPTKVFRGRAAAEPADATGRPTRAKMGAPASPSRSPSASRRGPSPSRPGPKKPSPPKR